MVCDTISKDADRQTDTTNYNLIHGKLLSDAPPGDEIVISGASGGFPFSQNIEEFKNNLLNKITMVTPNRRWGNVHAEIPECSGTIPVIEKFDAGFFGIHEAQSQSQDTMSRVFLERAIEAVFDSGIHPSELENTRTGVFIGACFSETEKTTFFDSPEPQRYGFIGCSRNMIAHRLSYYLKLKGPSFTTDTACSSSLYALEHAFKSLRLGEIDTAIVGGVNLCLHPFVSMQFARLGVLSIDGSCKVFDDAADGYARSETIGALILQRAKDAKRKYAEVVYAKTNCDGYKETGITFPSKIAQQRLLEEFYDECSVDRFSLSYLEAHGTGTYVGDPEEASAIDDVLTKGRKTHLLIGSVKSNIGHSEPSSGIASIVKCIIGLETGYIPPNSHYKTPSKRIPGILDGRLKVVSDKIPFEDDKGLIGVNSFGFGGGNCHILLRSNKKEKINSGIPADNIPRILCVSGRTEEAVTTLLDEVKSDVLDAEHIRLLHDIFRFTVQNHLFRGFSVISKSGEVCRFLDRFQGNCMPLYLAFGELHDWHNIGNQLMILPAFFNSIQRIQEKISIYGVNLTNTIYEETVDRETYHILGSVAVQIALIDMFKLLKIQPKYYYGYSFGNLLSAYSNDILSMEETVICALIINESVNKISEVYEISNKKTQSNDRKNRTSHEYICNSSILEKLRGKIRAEKSSALKKQMQQNLSNTIRSNAINNKLSKVALAFTEYFVEALTTTNVSQTFEHMEKNSIVLKVGTFPVNQDIEDVKMIPFFSLESESHLLGFLKVLGNLYVNGHNPHLANLYPEIQFPVSRGTKMISPYIKWKHDRDFFIPLYDLMAKSVAQHGTRTVKIQLTDQEWSYVNGHVIDGRNLFPATGYLFLAWETLCIIDNMPLSGRNVAFENCKFSRATTVPSKGLLTLRININKISGQFEILESDSTVMSGRIYVLDDSMKTENDKYLIGITDGDHLPLKTKDIYKELRLRGYNYQGGFRNIVECDRSATEGRIRWNGNWVTFLDNMLQMMILKSDTRLLYVPTFIEYLKIKIKDQVFPENETILPVYSDASTGIIRSQNAVIKGLIASSIARRKDLGVPVLEKYTFVPNITNLDILDSVRVNTQILLENALVYKVKVVEVIDEFTQDDSQPLIAIVKTVFEDQPLIQTLAKILSKKEVEGSIPVEDKKLSDETDCMLVIVSRLFERPDILQNVLSSLKDNGFIITREPLDFELLNAEKLDVSMYTVHKTQSETLVLLRKKSKPKKPIALNIDSSKDFDWIGKLKDIIKNKSSDNVILYSENNYNSGILGLVNCLRREPESSFVKCLFVMDALPEFRIEDPFYSEQLNKNMAFNIFKNGVWGTYRHLLLKNSGKVESEHCFANPLLRGDLSSLQWIEGPLRHDMIVSPEKKLIYVYYAALNFRDIMTASGRINADVVTTDRIQQECVQGFEFAGLDAEGNRVMGMVTHGALSSLILADDYITFKAPEGISLQEAATIPVVYGTVIYAMFLRGRMKRGDTVLIHSGTGGVGQAAIRMALHYGCKVYTTVGNQAKRDFLRKTFPALKDQHIGNSHDLSFEKLVMRGTKGRGVDIVLNSLADDKLLASVRCLAKGGRFVEIGKFDLANNTALNLLLLEKDRSFHGVMLDQLISSTPAIKSEISNMIRQGLEDGSVKPLDRSVFKYDQLEEAFRFMASGKHMGKVVVELREPEPSDKVLPLPTKFPCTVRYSCDPNKSYIIVGGLGGFGLELADWLILRGARKLVLTSRKGISTGYQNYRISFWRSYGVKVHISKMDITSREGCRSLIIEALNLGDVKAIFNLAVVLADAVFDNQNEESFNTSFGPKPVATLNLDEISRELCPNLSDFVVFSSVTCGRGNAGQSNYGMANSVMERLCEKRKQDGYPALAIQWGAIGEVGLVAEMQEIDCELEIGGTLQQKVSSCLNVLDVFLRHKDLTIASSMVVAEKRGALENAGNIVDAVINILGVNAQSVSFHATLAELGMDSMTAVEIKQILEREFEVFLSAKDMRTMTLAKLKKIQEEKSTNINEEEGKTINNFGMDMLFRLFGDDNEIKLPLLRLNESKFEGKTIASKVLLFPGIDGFGRVFKDLSNSLEDQAIAFQYSYNQNPETIIDMAKLLLPTLKQHLSLDEPFLIVAYSFGSTITLEVVSILESMGYHGTVVLIDGSPALSKKLLNELNLESEQLFEVYLLTHLLSFYLPSTVVAQHEENLLKCDSWESRINLASNLVGDRTDYSAETQKLIATGMYKRMKALKSYNMSYDKIKSKVKLVKPKVPIAQGVHENYWLSEICEQQVDVEIFDGNHITVLDNLELADAINNLSGTNNKK